MVLDGHQVISQSTENNGRLLSVYCILILISDFYGLKSNEWMILGNRIPADVFNGLAPVFLIGLVSSYFLHWWADHVSYVNWFKRAELVIGTMDKLGAFKNTEDSLSGLKRRLDWLVQEVPKLEQLETVVIVDGKELTAQQVASNTRLLSNQMREVIDSLQGIERKFEYVKGAGFLLVYVWHFFVPLFLVSLAAVSLAFGFLD